MNSASPSPRSPNLPADIAYPVFRTTDPALALGVARQLVAVGEQPYAEFSVDVELPTAREALRMREANTVP